MGAGLLGDCRPVRAEERTQLVRAALGSSNGTSLVGLARDLASGSDERRDPGRRFTVAAHERDDGGLRVSHWHERDVGALVVAGDDAGHKADAATGGDEGDDLLHARARGSDASGQAVSSLFAQPSRPHVVARERGVDDEAFLAQVSELERVAVRERMGSCERDEGGSSVSTSIARSTCPGTSRERDVDRSVDDPIEIPEKQFATDKLRAGWRALKVLSTPGNKAVAADGKTRRSPIRPPPCGRT